jgi:hypothetical protein
MDPTSRAVLAQVSRAGRDAVRLPADLACAPAGLTVGVPLKVVDFVGSLKVVDFVGSAGRLAWAKANGCPWVARTFVVIARGGNLKVLRWARAHGCPWNRSACWFAASRWHLDDECTAPPRQSAIC